MMEAKRLVFSFPRDKPFGLDVPFGLVERYRDEVARELRSEYAGWDVEVVILDTGLGDVELEPATVLEEDARLRLALDVKRLAHRVADAMFADGVATRSQSAGDA